jgi:hypothetical protein
MMHSCVLMSTLLKPKLAPVDVDVDVDVLRFSQQLALWIRAKQPPPVRLAMSL